MTENLEKELLDTLDAELPEVGAITEEMVETSAELAQNRRYLVGDVRIATGRVWPTKEYEARRQRVLSTPLP